MTSRALSGCGILVLLALAGCAEEKEPIGVGSPCSSAPECGAGFECVKSALIPRGLWQSCGADQDPCQTGLICAENDGESVCMTPDPGPGETGYDEDCEELSCVAPLFCEITALPNCVEMPDGTVECVDDTLFYNCNYDAEASITKLGSCEILAPVPVGGRCISDAECVSGLRCGEAVSMTVGGFYDPCGSEDTLCGEVLACDEANGTCLALPAPEGLAGWFEECVSDADCMTGLTCNDFQSSEEEVTKACLHLNVGVQDVRKCEMVPGDGRLGEPCYGDTDCMSLVCLESEYGPPFCSRTCETVEEPCPAGPDAADGQSLCISFVDLPDPNAPPFIGDLETFCVPRCSLDVQDCIDQNPNWEVCQAPTYLGDPLYPNLGTNYRICQALSFQGKDPVDPLQCNWEKTVGSFANEANMCRKYCSYLETCKVIEEPELGLACCEWGCFNRMVFDGEVNDPWYDEAKCYVDVHYAFGDVGAQNRCNMPPQDCGGVPGDPTPPAAAGPEAE